MPKLSAREVALLALMEIEAEAAYANVALERALTKGRGPQLAPRDRALATELVYGVSRRLGTLDWLLSQLVKRPLAKLTPPIRGILRMAAYQLVYLERIPSRAVVSEAVNLARRFGHEGVAKFVNGVLRNLQRRLPELLKFPPEQRLALEQAHPQWLVEQWVDRFGEVEAEQLLAANNEVPPVTLRTNRLKTTRAELLSVLQANGLEAVPTRHAPAGVSIAGLTSLSGLSHLPPFQAGWCTVQDESSMLVAPVVDPQPGELVIDVAAAPGGKSTHLAELMGNRGRVIALDLYDHKLKQIAENAKRLGTTCVEPRLLDGRKVGELFAGEADRVLVDAPCSGLGTLARRPDARWRKQPTDALALADIQLQLLQAAARALKPGGVLVYSTCTISELENEALIRHFLELEPRFALDDLRPYLPESLGDEGAAGWVQLLPQRHGTDGFFIARLRHQGK